MGKLHKGQLFFSNVSMYILVMVVFTEVYQISAASQMEKTDKSHLSRRKRQAADFILMGYKAQRAIKGTTRPSEFFRRIGKKRSSSPNLRETELILSPNGFEAENYFDPDEKLQHW